MTVALFAYLLLAQAAVFAATPSLAVVGLRTHAPKAADCAWLGSGIGDGISGRLASEATGIRQVDRAYIAEVLLAAGIRPLDEDGSDPARVGSSGRALSRPYVSPGDRGAQASAATSRQAASDGGRASLMASPTSMVSRSERGGRIPATHLLVGSVTAERGLGEDRTVTLRARVVDVATSMVVPNSSVQSTVPATAEGLQRLEAQVAVVACQALGGDATAVDLKVDVERSAIYAQLAEASRLVYDGRPEEALKITQALASSLKPEMLGKLGATEAAAYQALIDEAVQQGRRADSAALAEEAKRREQELRNQYEQAKRKSADDAEAIAEYSRALALNPDDPEIWLSRANAYYDLKQYEQAIADYTKAIELDPGDAAAYYNRGIAYRALEQYERAIADYDKAIELDPEDADAYINRGLAYCALKQYEQAIADDRKAVELAPQDVAPRSNLCFHLYLAGRLDEAIAAGREAVALAPDYGSAVGNLALALLASGRDDEAVAQYRRLVEISAQEALDAGCGKNLEDLLAQRPDLHLAHFCLGLLYEGAGKKADAGEHYRAYVAGTPEGKWASEARKRLAGVEQE